MLSNILNKKYNFDFFSSYKYFIISSIILSVISVILIFAKGVNKGIDFAGGILIEIRSEEQISLENLRNILDEINIGEVSLQNIGDDNDVMIRVGGQDVDEKIQMKKISLIKEVISENFDKIEYRRVDFVGPIIGKELIKSSVIALFCSFIAILLYIWIRFNYRFGFGALLALVHDVLLTFGLLIILQLEFNLTAIAALLTIIGYSINDSVVIFDRIRENSQKYRSLSQNKIITKSLNETLNRTILTALTTIIALLSLVLLGGEVLKTFSIAVLFGVFVGTYSSIFIATSTILTKSKI
ncbi:MAG: protein translocase subunit SecF [Rickettsiales bacterium]|nr:protein translocase subunit SecF [Rickettsiales bacterium]